MNANNRSPGPKNGNDGGGSGGGGQARLPGIGGLFGEGFPTLKPAGTNRVPGKPTEILTKYLFTFLFLLPRSFYLF